MVIFPRILSNSSIVVFQLTTHLWNRYQDRKFLNNLPRVTFPYRVECHPIDYLLSAFDPADEMITKRSIVLGATPTYWAKGARTPLVCR